MRYQRVSRDQLNHDARTSHHLLQAQKATEMLDNGWHCTGWKEREGSRVVFMQRGDTCSSVTHGVLYPNGRFQRPIVGKKSVQYNWSDVHASAEASKNVTVS